MAEEPTNEKSGLQPNMRNPVHLGAAITSLIFGIGGLLPMLTFLAIPAILFGCISLTQIKRDPVRFHGKRLAKVGITLGLLGPMLTMILTVGAPALGKRSHAALVLKDSARLKAIANACKHYSQFDGVVASSLDDMLVTQDITSSDLQSPFDKVTSNRYDYFFVSYPTANGCPTGLLPPTWIQAYGDPADNGHRGANILYLDGTVVFHRQPEFDAEIARFMSDYQAQCGSPPVIYPPS